MAEFRQRDCDVVAVSTDAVTVHERWLTAGQGGIGSLNFPLASDEDGSVSRAYGVYVARQHVALRGLFIIDPNGVLQYQVVHSLSVGRGTDEVLRMLDALQVGGLCPSNWTLGQPNLDASQELGPGRVVGQYRIEAVVGRGAFGTVFKARDLQLDRSVALKVLRTSGPNPSDSIFDEARAAAALNHPNVCTLHAVDASHGFPMIVMEYIDGQTLAERLTAGPLTKPEAAVFGRQIAEGLTAAHSVGVVHGDLKPANVMITPRGTAKLMDFGLSRRVGGQEAPDATIALGAGTLGTVSGTPSYMAPEQSRGEAAGPPSDVFAFGLVLYEMLTGRRALEGDSIQKVFRQLGALDADVLASGVQEPFATVLRSTLRLDPAGRSLPMSRISDMLHQA